MASTSSSANKSQKPQVDVTNKLLMNENYQLHLSAMQHEDVWQQKHKQMQNQLTGAESKLRDSEFVNSQLTQQNAAQEKEIQLLKKQLDDLLSKKNVWMTTPQSKLLDGSELRKQRIQTSNTTMTQQQPSPVTSPIPSIPLSPDTNIVKLLETKTEQLQAKVDGFSTKEKSMREQITELEEKLARRDSELTKIIKETGYNQTAEVMRMKEVNNASEFLQHELNETKKSLFDAIKFKSDLEKRLKQSEEQLREFKTRNTKYENDIMQFKTLITHLDQTNEQLTQTIETTQKQASMNAKNAERAFGIQDDLGQKLASQIKEVEHLRTLVRTLDIEKDNLMSELDEKDVKLSELSTKVSEYESTRKKLQSSVDDNQQTVERQVHQLQVKSQEVAHLKDQVFSMGQELQMYRSDNEFKAEEMGKIIEDLKNMAMDNQFVHNDLLHAKDEIEKLKRRNDESLQRAISAEQHAKKKDYEIDELMNSYKALNHENIHHEEGVRQLNQQLSDCKTQLTLREQELQHIREQAFHLEQESANQMMTIQALEGQYEAMTKKCSLLQDQIEDMKRDKERLMKDASKATHVTIDLEQEKSKYMRDALSFKKQLEFVQISAKEMEQKYDHLKNINREQSIKIAELERILSEVRVKEVCASTSEKELKSECMTLKDAIHKLQLDKEELGKQVEIAEQKNKRMLEKLSSSEQQVTSKEKELQRIIEKQNSTIQRQSDDLEKQKNYLVKYESHLNKQNSELVQYKEVATHSKEELSTLRKENERLKSLLQSKDTQISSETDVHIKLREREASFAAQLRASRDELHKVQTKYVELRQENQRLQDLLGKMDNDRANLQKEYNVLLEMDRKKSKLMQKL